MVNKTVIAALVAAMVAGTAVAAQEPKATMITLLFPDGTTQGLIDLSQISGIFLEDGGEATIHMMSGQSYETDGSQAAQIITLLTEIGRVSKHKINLN